MSDASASYGRVVALVPRSVSSVRPMMHLLKRASRKLAVHKDRDPEELAAVCQAALKFRPKQLYGVNHRAVARLLLATEGLAER